MEQLDDAALARRIAAPVRDAAAEEALCRRFGPRIRAYGMRHLRNPAAADDLVQEVLAQTLVSLREGRVHDPAMLASFVLGSARFVARNRRRTDLRRQGLLERFAAEQPTQYEAEPVTPDARLQTCLSQLRERERTVVVLTYYVEQSGERIAEELGMSPGNVRVVRHRALARLLACMDETRESP